MKTFVLIRQLAILGVFFAEPYPFATGEEPANEATKKVEAAPRRTLRFDPGDYANYLTPDGNLLMTNFRMEAGHDNAKASQNRSIVKFWRFDTGKLHFSMGDTGKLNQWPQFTFSRTGQRAVMVTKTSGSDGNMEFWDLQKGALERTLTVEIRPRPFYFSAISNDGSLVADLYRDAFGDGPNEKHKGGADIYEWSTGKKAFSIRAEHGMPNSALFSACNRSLVILLSDASIRSFDLSSGKETARASLPKNWASKPVLSQDGKSAFLAVHNDSVQVFDMHSLKTRPGIRPGLNYVSQLQTSPNGQYLMFSGFQNQRPVAGQPYPTESRIEVWNAKKEELVRSFDLKILTNVFLTDHEIAFRAEDRTVHVYELEGRR